MEQEEELEEVKEPYNGYKDQNPFIVQLLAMFDARTTEARVEQARQNGGHISF